MTSLRVEAFGRTIQVSSAQLTEIDGGQFNLVQLSYERGYMELGGRTICIRLAKGFTSGKVTAVVVMVTEDGSVKITR